jgi:hypothetical protein
MTFSPASDCCLIHSDILSDFVLLHNIYYYIILYGINHFLNPVSADFPDQRPGADENGFGKPVKAQDFP